MAIDAAGDVATGTKPIATGAIRRKDRRALLDVFRRSGLSAVVKIGFREADGDNNIGYCFWRFRWAKEALDFLDSGGRDQLGDFHRHWVQGLLFGYSYDSIDDFLAKPSERASRSQPSCRSRTEEISPPSIAGSDSCGSRTDTPQIRGRIRRCEASLGSFRGGQTTPRKLQRAKGRNRTCA
jgi:hypothetical protein